MPTKPSTASQDAQREALERAEKNAAAEQPKSYRDEATAEKIVEIGPDKTYAPIEGIDPPERGERESIETGRKG